MAPTRYLTALLTLASFTAAASVPAARKVYPEVIPGPGLPSLAELGITSEELYTTKPDLTPVSIVTRNVSLMNRAALFDAECGPSDEAYTDVNDIIACYNYLRGLGTTICAAPGNYGIVQMCSAGQGQVSAQTLDGNPSSSYCSDVSLAVLWVINDCTRPDQSVAGFQAANGNGDLIIGSVNIDW